MMTNMTTGKNTSVEFTPACLAVIAKWRAKGRKLTEIVNSGVMAYNMIGPEGREQALDAAFANPSAITDPSDSALGEQLIRDAAARSGLPAETRENSGGGGQRSRREPGRKAG